MKRILVFLLLILSIYSCSSLELEEKQLNSESNKITEINKDIDVEKKELDIVKDKTSSGLLIEENKINKEFNDKEIFEESIINEFTFSEAKDIKFELDLPKGEYPKPNNNSKIYFVSTNNNNGNGNTLNGVFKLEGLIINDVEKIEVIWDGDNESYFLSKYVPGNKEFVYNISNKFNNINIGENKYLIRGYSKYGLYQRIFTLNYYDFLSGNNLKPIEKIFKSEENLNIGYILEGDIYNLGIDYGKYSLTINDSKIEFYNYPNNSSKKSYVRIIRGDKDFIYNDYSFITDMFSNNMIKTFDNGDLLFSKSGHESANDYLYFSSYRNNFFRIFDIIKKEVDNPNFYNETNIIDGNLIIKSINNPWSSGKNNYELKINTKELLNYF